jgi:transposase
MTKREIAEEYNVSLATVTVWNRVYKERPPIVWLPDAAETHPYVSNAEGEGYTNYQCLFRSKAGWRVWYDA